MHTNFLRLSVFIGTAASVFVFQQTIPIRQLSPAEATSSEAVFIAGAAIELSDGRVLFNDRTFQKPRLILFDSKLATATTVADSTTLSSGPRRNFGFTAIRFRADSTAVPDPNGNTLMVLDGNGKNANVMTMPRPIDAGIVSGNAAFDAQYRLVYRGSFPSKPIPPSASGSRIMLPQQPDTFPLVRADFDSRAMDTIAMVRVSTGFSMTAIMENNRIKMTQTRQPLPITDDWVVLSDGTLAIVRGQDYHVDWIRPDGKKESSPKMPFDWRRVTDEDKDHMVDSLKAQDARNKAIQDSISAARGQPAGSLSSMINEIVPIKDIPDYYPPIRFGTVAADREAHLWILPTTSAQAKGGLLYDVINTKGEVFERVQLPPSCALAGFGLKSRVYLACTDKVAGDTTTVAHLKRMQVIH